MPLLINNRSVSLAVNSSHSVSLAVNPSQQQTLSDIGDIIARSTHELALSIGIIIILFFEINEYLLELF